MDKKIKEIVQEEIARMKVKDAIEHQSKKKVAKQRLWDLLNSAFSLWLLSTIIVGIATWTYSGWKNKQNRKQEARSMIEKLDTELAYRLDLNNEDALKKALEEYNEDVVPVVCAAPMAMRDDYYNNGYTVVGRFIFPEFKERNIFSLLWELEKLVSKRERAEIQSARTALKEVRDCIEYEEKYKQPVDTYIKRIKLARWTKE